MMRFKEITQTYIGLLDRTIEKLDSLCKDKAALCASLAETMQDSNNQRMFWDFCGSDTEALIEAVYEGIDKIEKFDLESQMKFIRILKKEYTHINSKEVHPDVIGREMIEYVHIAAKQFSTFIESEELRTITSPLIKAMGKLFQAEPECANKGKQFEKKLSDCKQQYYENLKFLKTLFDFFSVPTECPPHL